MTDLARPDDGDLSAPAEPELIAPGSPEALPDQPPAEPPADSEGLFKQILFLGFRMNWYFLRLATTRRVRIGWKFRIFLGFVYLISPIDLIPEALLGPIGLLDDAFLAAILPDRMLNGPSEETFAHCWGRGGRRAIDAVRRFASAVARAVPGLARRPMAAFLGSPDGGSRPPACPFPKPRPTVVANPWICDTKLRAGREWRPREADVKVIRMLVLVLFIALLGGAFGAGIGGLVGYGFPRTIAGQYEVQDRTVQPNSGESGQTVSKGAKIAVGEGDDWSTARKGAALGGAIGLIAGLVLGIPLALMDQFVAQIVEWMAGRKERKHGDPGDPDPPPGRAPSRGGPGVGSP